MMTLKKFLLSRHHIPKKVDFYFASKSPRLCQSYCLAFARTLSSKPNVKSTDEATGDNYTSSGPIKKPNLKGVVKYSRMMDEKHKIKSEASYQEPVKPNQNERPMQRLLQLGNYLPQENNIEYIHECYLSLSKSRLTSMVVATAGAGYVMSPAPLVMLPMMSCLVGTALAASAANTINQIIEAPYDAQMSRTKNRPLVRGFLSPLNATTYAALCATTGLSVLWVGVNPLVCGLGLTNIILYAFIYTPLKRISIANTWVGSIVGAIPPLMGWAACSGSLDPNAFILAAILYAWQFPHFNALSWGYKADYARAGYRMTCICNEGLCRRAALRYSLLMIPICTASCYMGLTTWSFAQETLPVNLYLIYLSYNFYRKGDSKTSRSLFRFSLAHLPLLMVLLILNKSCKRKDNAMAPVL